ncbi:Molybdopterin biosynthesis protein MoeB [Thiomonas sp. CB3]|nr:Molybdopterin biosynthesis protein MoeB [Thiomonas sp. CB3]
MDAPRLCLLGSLEYDLKAYLSGHPMGYERVAVVMFRRYRSNTLGLPASDRFVAVEIQPFEESWFTGRSEMHFEFSLRYLRTFFQRCEEEGLVFGLAHSHPSGNPDFSLQDDENEQTLLRAIANRNGRESHLVALILCDGNWYGRLRCGQTPEYATTVRHIAVLGERLDLHAVSITVAPTPDDTWARQAAAFGQPFVDKLQSLRVAVVGCSGTGSPAATLLARAGVGEIVLIDHDQLEVTNLNRVRGARKVDVGHNKAEIARNFIQSMGINVQATAIDALVDVNPDAIDALMACDIVFGCTDDDLGRQALNAAVSFYGLAYIDLGLGGRIDTGSDGIPRMTHQHGRVSMVLPEYGECLYCQQVTNDRDASRQQAIRDNPDITEDELRERYLDGGRVQSPGVGPFTSAVADLGVATLFDLIQPYRNLPGELRRDLICIDFVRMTTFSMAQRNDVTCVYCGTRKQKLRATPYRLGRPQLGRYTNNA